MNGGGDEMAHDDIWDDSALVASWNEALDEYKKYHSIHATGGKLEDIAPAPQTEHAKPETSSTGGQHSGGGDNAVPLTRDAVDATQNVENRIDDGNVGVSKASSGTENTRNREDQQHHEPSQIGGGGGASAMAPPPQALLGFVQDEGLKRLLMSWYYAGYYTGLWEGEQKHRNEQQHQQQHQQQQQEAAEGATV